MDDVPTGEADDEVVPPTSPPPPSSSTPQKITEVHSIKGKMRQQLKRMKPEAPQVFSDTKRDGAKGEQDDDMESLAEEKTAKQAEEFREPDAEELEKFTFEPEEVFHSLFVTFAFFFWSSSLPPSSLLLFLELEKFSFELEMDIVSISFLCFALSSPHCCFPPLFSILLHVN